MVSQLRANFVNFSPNLLNIYSSCNLAIFTVHWSRAGDLSVEIWAILELFSILQWKLQKSPQNLLL